MGVTSAGIAEGETRTLTVTVTPESITDKVTWSSSDESVATVDSEGKVTALKAGTTVITATTSNGLTSTCYVTVTAMTVEATSVTIDKTSVILTAGETDQLTATVQPDNATDTGVAWKSDDETVASVSADGLVTALKPGTATVTVTSANGLSAECVVTVISRKATVGGIEYEVIYGDDENDANIVKVIGGIPDGNGILIIENEIEIEGKKYHVAETGEGAFKDRTDIKKVIISATVVSIGNEAFSGCLNLEEIVAEDGEETLCCGKNAFQDAPIKNLYLGRNITGTPFAGKDSLTDLTIGDKVTTVGSGDFAGCGSVNNITVLNPLPPALPDGGFDEAVYKNTTVRVPDENTGDYKSAAGWKNFFEILGIDEIVPVAVEIEVVNPELTVGESTTLKAIITPENATDITVTWSSSDESVATVDANGLVTAIKTGKAIITATTKNGLKATCEVTVVPETVTASGLTIDIEEVEMVEAATLQLTATVTPENATDRTVTWGSSDESVATVDANGLVTAIKTGKAIITATTKNGLKATCKVTVTAKPSGINGIESEDTQIRVDGNNIIAPEGSEIFDLNGHRVKATALRAGIYIVRISGKKAVKVKIN
ncbi:MAG: Ig-like domain-containing protein [Paramuribaculum sp.]|nr:Ig-like domain-containing protein [Paramuribaculum sp.]